MVLLTREQLEDRLVALHRASLELVSDLSLETVLERIVTLAREQSGARYAALGVVNDAGDLVQFIPIGMTKQEIERIPHPPIGRGLLGAMRDELEPVRIPEISADPRSVGFPKNHPDMHSFLGVPILQGERLLGQIYLTDKMDYPEFTREDERVLETLAAYAAIAITNARHYDQFVRRDRELQIRNDDLKLLNDVATTLTSSLDIDDILAKTLDLVMEYLSVEAGEIFLVEDGEQELHLALHRGDLRRSFFQPGPLPDRSGLYWYGRGDRQDAGQHQPAPGHALSAPGGAGGRLPVYLLHPIDLGREGGRRVERGEPPTVQAG